MEDLSRPLDCAGCSKAVTHFGRRAGRQFEILGEFATGAQFEDLQATYSCSVLCSDRDRTAGGNCPLGFGWYFDDLRVADREEGGDRRRETGDRRLGLHRG